MSVRTGLQLWWAVTVTGHSLSGLWRQPTALPVPAQTPWGLPHPCPWPRTPLQPSLWPSILSLAHPQHLPRLLWLTLDLAHASGWLVSHVLHWWWIWTDWFCRPALPFEAQWDRHFPAVACKWQPTLKLRSASDPLSNSAWCEGQVRGGMLRLDEDYASLAPYHQKVNNLSVSYVSKDSSTVTLIFKNYYLVCFFYSVVNKPHTKYSNNSVVLFTIFYHSYMYFCPGCFIPFYHNWPLHTISVQSYLYFTAVFCETSDHVILPGSCVG